MAKLKTALKKGQIFELSSGTYQYKILKVWEAFESGSRSKPVIMGEIHRIKKDGTLIKSEKPRTIILEYHYGGKPLLAGEIIK